MIIAVLGIAPATSAEAALSLEVNSTNTTVALVGSGTAPIPSFGTSVYRIGSATGGSQAVNLNVATSPLTAQLQIFEGGGLIVLFNAGDSEGGVNVVGSGIGTSYAGDNTAILESFQGSSLSLASGTDIGPLSVTTAAVPEPSALVLSALLVVFMCTHRRRSRPNRIGSN